MTLSEEQQKELNTYLNDLVLLGMQLNIRHNKAIQQPDCIYLSKRVKQTQAKIYNTKHKICKIIHGVIL